MWGCGLELRSARCKWRRIKLTSLRDLVALYSIFEGVLQLRARYDPVYCTAFYQVHIHKLFFLNYTGISSNTYFLLKN